MINPILLLLASGAGLMCCGVAGINPHLREMELALVVCLLASQMALIPVVFQKNATLLGRTQAALVGLIIHLILAALLAAGILLLAKPVIAFAWWMLAFYWLTLAGLTAVLLRAVRTASTTDSHSAMMDAEA